MGNDSLLQKVRFVPFPCPVAYNISAFVLLSTRGLPNNLCAKTKAGHLYSIRGKFWTSVRERQYLVDHIDYIDYLVTYVRFDVDHASLMVSIPSVSPPASIKVTFYRTFGISPNIDPRVHIGCGVDEL